MKIGDNIKRFRKEKGISQKQLAEILKIPVSTLANYENNHREPSIGMLMHIVNTFNITLDALMEDTEEKAIADALCDGDITEMYNRTLTNYEISKLRDKYITKYMKSDRSPIDAKVFFDVIYRIVNENFSLTLPESYKIFDKVSKEEFDYIVNLIKSGVIGRIYQLNIAEPDKFRQNDYLPWNNKPSD